MATLTDEQINTITRIYEQQRPQLAKENTNIARQLSTLADRLIDEILSDEYGTEGVSVLRDASVTILNNALYHVQRARAFATDGTDTETLDGMESVIGETKETLARV